MAAPTSNAGDGAGLAALGTYVPGRRLAVKELRAAWPSATQPPGVRSVAVADTDEDVVTMGVAAARAALTVGDVDPSTVGALYFATCSSPWAEHSAGWEAALGLGLDQSVSVVDLAGSTTGAVAALRAAADAVASGRVERALVIAADDRRTRPGLPLEALGAGAVAAVVAAGAPLAVENLAAWRQGTPTRWRNSGESGLEVYDDLRFETHQQQPAIRAALHQFEGSSVGVVVAGPLSPRAAQGLARAIGTEVVVADESAEIGDLGTAAPLAELASLMAARDGESPEATVGLVGCEAAGAVEALALRARGRVPVRHVRPAPRPVSYVQYLQATGVLPGAGTLKPIVPWPATPGAARDLVTGAWAGNRCAECGGLQVPPRRVCAHCGGASLTVERPATTGTVVTHNLQHVVAVEPEPVPVAVGVIRLHGEEDGPERCGATSMMFTADHLDRLAVGAEVDVVYRRVGDEHGLVKYGWKAQLRPAETTETEPA